jgi:DNA-directed RNA polymerase subunit N (RpoN/RPB10)
MLYSVCPTCGYFLANKIVNFEKSKEDICNNPSLTDEDKEKQLSKLVLSLKLKRPCCIMRFMTYKDLVQDILAPSNE